MDLAMSDCHISSPQDVKFATEFLHHLGALIWFDSPESGLSDMVILDSQWLTKVFSSVVSAKNDPIHGMSGNIKAGTYQNLFV